MKILAAAILAALPALASAQAPTQPEVVVTATRRAETVDDTLASVTVITREDLDRLAAPDLFEALRLEAGIDLVRTGGSGSATTLFLRGTNSNHTLVLVDGVRVSSTPQGIYDLAHLPPEQVERIEIVRGPRASFWGSEAIGGVVQIFTRRPDGVIASVRGGSYGRAGATVAYGARGENGGYGVTLGGEKLDGFNATNPRSFSFDPDDDGYHNRNASVRADTALGTHRLDFAALSTDADVEFDRGLTSSIERSGTIGIGGPLGERWSHEARLGHSRGELETLAFGSRYVSRRTTLDWQNTIALTPTDTLVAGINLAREEGRSDDTFGGDAIYDESRNNKAVHGSWRHARERFDAELAARLDDNGQFGSEDTYQGALGWRFSDRVRGWLSGGEGFRAPNLNELYSPGFGGRFAGNPLLEPERSKSVELGLEWRATPAQVVTARAYDTRVRDLISFEGANFRAINIKRARVRGAELEWTWRGESFGVRANYTYSDAEDRDTGLALLRRARHKANVELTQRIGQFEWGVEGIGASDRRDFGAGLPGYFVANARASWRFTDAWRVDARVDNLFDRQYELASGYNTSDAALRVAVVYDGSE